MTDTPSNGGSNRGSNGNPTLRPSPNAIDVNDYLRSTVGHEMHAEVEGRANDRENNQALRKMASSLARIEACMLRTEEHTRKMKRSVGSPASSTFVGAFAAIMLSTLIIFIILLVLGVFGGAMLAGLSRS